MNCEEHIHFGPFQHPVSKQPQQPQQTITQVRYHRREVFESQIATPPSQKSTSIHSHIHQGTVDRYALVLDYLDQTKK